MSARLLAMSATLMLLIAGTAGAEEAIVSYTWTGPGNRAGLLAPRAGNKNVGYGKCEQVTMTIDVRIQGRTVSGAVERLGHRRKQFHTELGEDGVFLADVEQGDHGAGKWGKSAGGEGPTHPGLSDNELHIRGVVNGSTAEISVDGICHYEGPLTRK